MKLKDLITNAGIVSTHADLDIETNGVCYDSRKLQVGELFVAIRGLVSDGHSYIDDVMANGAVAVLCEVPPKNTSYPYIIVEDTRSALAIVSAVWFGNPAKNMQIIGITGTNGKTTVATLLKHVLEGCTGEKVGLIGTNVNMIGARELVTLYTTPESREIHELLSMMHKEECKYVVMEVSSHALELNRVHGINFEIGVYTNLSVDHLDFHASMDDYAAAKSKLFASSRHSIINLDDDYAHLMTQTASSSVYTYAVDNGDADLVAKRVKLHADHVDFCALAIGNLTSVELGIPGMFSIYNALAVISATVVLGIDTNTVAAELQQCSGVKGRAEVVPTDGDYTVIIDYAHTPDALENIILAARYSTNGRVVTLFGCGGDRDRSKRSIMGAIAAKYSDFVIVTSDNPRTEDPDAIITDILTGMEGTSTPYRMIENRREAIRWALENARSNDVIILAGKGHETYQIFGTERKHFDEREVVAEYLLQDYQIMGV